MASSVDNSERIRDVGRDKYNIVAGQLASTGANTCVIFIVLFKQNNNIFIEHRNSFPDKPGRINMKKCLRCIVSHIDESTRGEATISSVYIFGGNYTSNEKNVQNAITQLINENDRHISSTYSDFINNIKYMNAMINLNTQSPGITGECNINIIVNHFNNVKHIILAQYCSKLVNGLTESLIGVMVWDLTSEKMYFSIGNNPLNNQENEEQVYQHNAISNFKTTMLNANGIEVFNDEATDLIEYVRSMEQDVQSVSDNTATAFGDEFY